MEPNHKLLLGTNYVCSLSQRRNLSKETASTTIGITEDVNQLGSRSKANANVDESTSLNLVFASTSGPLGRGFHPYPSL